ncbi:MAG: glycosyltransferase family 4 protein [Ruminococcaceae bacterium]|nr:glycosyltransferase family 4 protein [Oscillospiraceae bacterium]
MSKILVWETLSKIGGGQEMTLKVADILGATHTLHFLIPEEGELSNELKKRNIDYTLMGDQTMPKGQKGFKGLLKFIHLTVLAVIKGRKAVKSVKPDVLYAPGPAALVWSAMCAKRDTKVVWHMHHIFQSGATLKLLNIFSASKCVKKIISVSDYVGQQINNKKAESKKITVYNPVKAIAKDIARKNLCDEYSTLDKNLKIAQIGFITPTKRQNISIEVLERLKSTGVDASLAIIGSVRDGEQWYKEMLCEKIKAYELSQNVVFTGYRDDVMQIISTFDVVFVPSVEGFSLVAAQAILEGVPVLCVDNSGCTEIITNTSCGMIYSPDSRIDVIADTMLKTAEIDVKTMKKKHPNFILSECSDENFTRKMCDIFTF